MRRALLTVALAAAALPTVASAAPAPASVKVVSCSFADRTAAFYARMRQVPATSQMAMRFTLLQETGDSAEALRAPGLRRWHRSKPGVRAFGYRQAFKNLPQNASHRVRVDFRWYAEDGSELLRARRRSTRCRQFEELPNLTARITALMPTKVRGVVRYKTLVRNTGKAVATAVPLRLTVDGDVVDTLTLVSLAPGEERSLVIRGPECHRLAKLEVDPEQAIAESSDADNTYGLSCTSLTNLG